jgi:hypothetical protein
MLHFYSYFVEMANLGSSSASASRINQAFRVFTHDQQPNHSQGNMFRHVILGAHKGVYVQILRLYQKVGVVSLEE